MDQVVILTYNATTDTFVITPPTFPVMITEDNVAEGEEELTVVLTQFLPDIVIRAPNVSRLIIQDNGMTALTMSISIFKNLLYIYVPCFTEGGQC